jgi:hypothetical protein
MGTKKGRATRASLSLIRKKSDRLSEKIMLH